ncbi:MAG TPA: glycosyltransferase, partial [Cyclobacteriaceae bacterium]
KSPEMVKISGVIITYNEEKNISRCIDSLKEVCDEVVVLDCFSTDRTKEICEEKRIKFYQKEFSGFANQKNTVASLATYDYVLSLDADEYLSSELTQSILRVKNDWRHDGYMMNRLSSFAGTWIKTCGWYPDQKLRLWDRRRGDWQGEGVHEKVEPFPSASIKNLKGDLFHKAYDNVAQFLQKNQSYSSIHAQVNRYKTTSSTWKIIYKTAFAFFKAYILKGGILDGYKGLVISASNAHWVFFKYAKLLEANRSVRVSLVVESSGSISSLKETLTSIKSQKELPNEMILNGKSDQSIDSISEILKDFPIPFKIVSSKNTSGTEDAIAQASEEYILVLNDQEIISSSFVKDHKKNAWKGKVISGASAEKSEQLIKLESKSIDNNTISFWKDDWVNNLAKKQRIASNGFDSSSVSVAERQDLLLPSSPKGISVVIPNYNGRQLFNETLSPLFIALSNSALLFEVIIVDDCSTDDSVPFLNENYPQIRVIQNDVNRGFAPTINRGIFQCNFDLVFLLNSDVKLEPDYFKYLIPYFEKSDTFGVMGRIVNWGDDQIQDGAKLPTLQGAKIKTFKNFLPTETPIQKGLNTMYLSGAEALVSREKLLMLGGFDEIFAPYYIEDYEMCLRAWRLGWKCYYEHRSVCRHKTSSTIKSKSKKRHVQTIYYRNKMFLHAIHLSLFQTLLYYPQLFFEGLLRILSFRFYYVKSFLLFYRDRKKCKESKEKFEELAKKVGTNLSLVKVADSIHHSLEHTPIWRF